MGGGRKVPCWSWWPFLPQGTNRFEIQKFHFSLFFERVLCVDQTDLELCAVEAGFEFLNLLLLPPQMACFLSFLLLFLLSICLFVYYLRQNLTVLLRLSLHSLHQSCLSLVNLPSLCHHSVQLEAGKLLRHP